MTASAWRTGSADRRDGVSFARLLWVAPLTVAVALAVNLAIKTVARALDPSLSKMGQLGNPLVILTLEGAVLAVVVFALMAWLVPHPIRRFRVVAVVALLVSLVPDLLLGLGGDARRTGSGMAGPFIRFGAQFFPAAPTGGRPPPSGPPPTLPGLPWGQALLLMLLHAATAAVCVALLTTLTRDPAARDVA